MKITIEQDLNIIQGNPPDMQTIIIDQHAGDLTEVLVIFDAALRAMGYCYKGQLEIVDADDL